MPGRAAVKSDGHPSWVLDIIKTLHYGAMAPIPSAAPITKVTLMLSLRLTMDLDSVATIIVIQQQMLLLFSWSTNNLKLPGLFRKILTRICSGSICLNEPAFIWMPLLIM